MAVTGLIVCASLATAAGCGDAQRNADRKADGTGSSTRSAGVGPDQPTNNASASGTSQASSDPASPAASSPGRASGATGPSSNATSGTGAGAPASGGTGVLTSDVLARLGKTHLTDTEMAAGATGTWKGTPVGALASGDDATLTVKDAQGWRIVGGWWPSKGLPGPYLGGKRHVLVLGSDARPGEDLAHSRADTIQIVGVDGTGGGGVMGIARDSYVPLSTGGKHKINAAMPAGGPGAMVSTVSSVSGIPLEGYLLTDFDGFVAWVDAIGGIPVNLPRPVKGLPAGQQNLSGTQALVLARERKTLPGGDFDRSSNQGMILASAAIKVRGQGVEGLPHLMSATGSHIQTSLSPARAVTMLANAYQVNPQRVGRSVAKGGFGWTADRQSIVLLDGKAFADFTAFRDGNL